MKLTIKILLQATFVSLLIGCSGKSSESTQAQEEELKVADSIATALSSEKEKLSKTTEESLQEIDSLLENL